MAYKINTDLEVTGQVKTSLEPVANVDATSKKYVDDNIQNVREVAEGKCRTFVMDATQESLTESYFTNGGVVYKTNGDAITTWSDFRDYVKANDQSQPTGTASYICSNSQLNISSNDTLRAQIGKYVSLNEEDFEYFYLLDIDNVVIVYNDEHVRKGDVFLIKQLSVPDRWFSGYQNYSGGTYDSGYYIKLEALEAKTNLSNYYAKNANLVPILNNAYDIGSSSYTFKDLYLGGRLYLGGGAINLYYNNGLQVNSNIVPNASNQFDLGSSLVKWTNLYLSGTAYVEYIGIGGQGLKAKTSFIPETNNSYNLGTASSKWSDLHLAGKLYGINHSFSIDDNYRIVWNYFISDTSATELSFVTSKTISLSADRTFTLASAPSSCYPEYKAIITNSGASAINLTFTGVTNIITSDDESASVSGNIITLAAGAKIEISIVAGNCICVVW